MNQYVFEPVKPVVETKYGRLRGVTYGEVNIFMGIPYAHAERFGMPAEPEPWEGIRNAYTYGPVSPQTLPPNPPSYYRGLHMLRKEGEDCQNLNIWAPRILNGEKKPVFVWIHGGGYFAGNALEEYSFDGFNLAHYGDVVFVSINHRLNILGFLDLSEYGPRFANSVNAGIVDIVMALKWIHENIAAFGGDPENVTLCGHSGGGGKVECMYQLEEAAPCFQRGIVLSGAMKEEFDPSPDDSRQMARAIVNELGLTEETIDEIRDVPFSELLAAYKRALPGLREKGVNTTWSPVANAYFPGFPGTVGFMPGSAGKPLIIGSMLGEFEEMTVHLDEDEKAAMTEENKAAFLLKRFGKHTDRLTALFREAYPSHDILDLAYTDTMVRVPAVKAALRHAENGKNNTYSFLAAYCTPEGGRIPVWHGGEVCYMLMNEDKVFVLNEAVTGQKMAKIFSTMVLNYAKYGDPNNKYLPEWKPLTEEHRYTMVIDRECACLEDHDRELMELLDPVNTSPDFNFD